MWSRKTNNELQLKINEEIPAKKHLKSMEIIQMSLSNFQSTSCDVFQCRQWSEMYDKGKEKWVDSAN